MQIALSSLFKKTPVADARMEQALAQMEESISDMFSLDEQDPPASDPSGHSTDDHHVGDAEYTGGPSSAEGDDPLAAGGTRLTAYSQSRLASLTAFETVHQAARMDMERVVSYLAKVTAAHHSTNTFLRTLHGSIHKSNELELQNAALLAENRRLAHNAERVLKLSGQVETLTEAYKRRETKMNDEEAALRANLGVLQIELNEARATVTAIESERAELINAIAGKTSVLDRITREAELTRERYLNLSMDLENAQRQQNEIERKYDELSAVHIAEHAQFMELRSKYNEMQKEIIRLQKSLDLTQSLLTEAKTEASKHEEDSERRDSRQTGEIQKLHSDLQSLRARMEVASRSQSNADNEIAALRQKVADLSVENKMAEDKVRSLSADLATERNVASSPRSESRTASGREPRTKETAARANFKTRDEQPSTAGTRKAAAGEKSDLTFRQTVSSTPKGQAQRSSLRHSSIAAE